MKGESPIEDRREDTRTKKKKHFANFSILLSGSAVYFQTTKQMLHKGTFLSI